MPTPKQTIPYLFWIGAPWVCTSCAKLLTALLTYKFKKHLMSGKLIKKMVTDHDNVPSYTSITVQTWLDKNNREALAASILTAFEGMEFLIFFPRSKRVLKVTILTLQKASRPTRLLKCGRYHKRLILFFQQWQQRWSKCVSFFKAIKRIYVVVIKNYEIPRLCWIFLVYLLIKKKKQ